MCGELVKLTSRFVWKNLVKTWGISALVALILRTLYIRDIKCNGILKEQLHFEKFPSLSLL